MIYAIHYDLRAPGRNYDSLYVAIRSFGRVLHPLESFWVIGSPFSPVEVREALARHIDQNDALAVFQMSGTGAWQGFNSSDSSALVATLNGI